MPATRKEHVYYTKNEWDQNSYFIKTLEILRENNIESYLDLGANVGEVCNVLFGNIKTLKVAHLVEPQIDNFLFLKENVVKGDREIYFYPVGIFYGEKEGKLYLDPSWPNPGSFSLLDSRSNFKEFGETVKLVTLEDLEIDPVDFVKIDVEGSEVNILSNSTYLKKCNLIDIEIHPSHDYPQNDNYLETIKKNLSDHNILIEDQGHVLLKKK